MFKKLATFLFPVVLGVLIGVYALPFLFSGQKDIDPDRLTGLFTTDERVGLYDGKPFASSYIPPDFEVNDVLGQTSDEKRIEVDLAAQKLYAFEGNNKMYEFPVSTGLWGKTPTGEFRIWIKLRYTRMEGGNKAIGTYYNLPNVPFTMFFYNNEIPKYRGFGIHGAYWHNNFGHPMSHGCINMRTEDVEKIYYWATPTLDGKPSIQATATNPGTRIIIYGTAPNY